MDKIYIPVLLGLSICLLSCNDSGNKPQSSTNTHNTSQPSAGAYTADIKIDPRSQTPPHILNDGNNHSNSILRTETNSSVANDTLLNAPEGQVNDAEENERDTTNQNEPVEEAVEN